MYCGDKHRPRFMRIKNGTYDVCKKPECFEIYKKSRTAQLKSAKRNKLRERIDTSWMTGE